MHGSLQSLKNHVVAKMLEMDAVLQKACHADEVVPVGEDGPVSADPYKVPHLRSDFEVL